MCRPGQALHEATKKEAELQEAELQKELRVVADLNEKLARAETNNDTELARNRQLSTAVDNLRRQLSRAEDQCKYDKNVASCGANFQNIAGWAKCLRMALRTPAGLGGDVAQLPRTNWFCGRVVLVCRAHDHPIYILKFR